MVCLKHREDMRPRKGGIGGKVSSVSSPEQERRSLGSGSSCFGEKKPSYRRRSSLPSGASVLDDRDRFLAEDGGQWLRGESFEDNQNDGNGGIGISGGLRNFPYNVKQQCWGKAEKVKGRDPDRWRWDPLGNIIFRKLVGCPGCLCHDYDHIVPFSKGGKSTLENCQVLQATVNRSKGNKIEVSKSELIHKSAYCRVSGRDMDLLELAAYGNVRRAQDSGGCNIQ
ncbi:hypothetical protein HPP92_025355 [Vanilla planifolia]|uniref:HNH nuclease domain-containing protein n=1 Tax=Vanilla planifolia TaxID=51239 RepID=A0A835U948_VANPL|nr:hypothetical protein HPP92_025656 [Vanilla planifolia]KAG0454051.1 hypothetical protein HPP92_025355 [Vanilla planifolia]